MHNNKSFTFLTKTTQRERTDTRTVNPTTTSNLSEQKTKSFRALYWVLHD